MTTSDSQRSRVLAIGLDAAELTLIEDWMEQGKLPGLASLRAEGAWGELEGPPFNRAETPWSIFLSGSSPSRTGYWGDISLQQGTYKISIVGADDFEQHPPFYSYLPSSANITVFDVPKTRVLKDLNGIQVTSWGAHSPGAEQASKPPGLLEDLQSRYGAHPALHNDDGDWWDENYLIALKKNLLEGLRRRTQILEELIQRDSWDLLLTVFGETHSAGHDFWHLGPRNHPLSEVTGCEELGEDPLFTIYKEIDNTLVTILRDLDDDTAVCLFSLHGTGTNSSDVPSMAVLPELLYRNTFSEPGFFPETGTSSPPPPPIVSGLHRTWTEEMWYMQNASGPWQKQLRRLLPLRYHHRFTWLLNSPNAPHFLSPNQLHTAGDDIFWQPGNWYRPHWENMPSFALPSFSEGAIRLNVEGRDPSPLISPEDYVSTCDQITELLQQVTCGRTGIPAVKEVIRTRQSDPFEKNAPDPDLIVMWQDEAIDVWDHPTLGRIGPLPYRRTGSHRSHGFVALRAPGLSAGTRLRDGNIVDLPQTILHLMGLPPNETLEGSSLLP